MNRATESASLVIDTDFPISQFRHRWHIYHLPRRSALALLRLSVAVTCLALGTGCVALDERKTRAQLAAIEFVAESTCHSYHVLQIFSDGVVRYEAHHRVLFEDGSATEKVLAQDYYQMDKVDLLRMIEIANKFQLVPARGLPADIAEDPSQPRFLYGGGTELMSQLHQLFDEALKVKWYQLPEDSMPCAVEKYRPTSGIQLNTSARRLIER